MAHEKRYGRRGCRAGCLRARLTVFSSLRDDNARAWLLSIVRNTWYSRFPKRGGDRTIELDDTADERPGTDLDPEARVIQQQAVERVRLALEQLPPDFREVVVLRELEGFSYKEIATIIDIPIGTVMSRLSRARERLIPILRSSEVPTGESRELS